MNVLHLPFNNASQISATVRALKNIGIETRGLVSDNATMLDPAGTEDLVKPVSRRRHPIRGTLQILALRRTVLDAIRWAEVVHWHSGWALPQADDVRWAARLGKVRVVEFWGSNIRIPRIASADNPFTAKMYRDAPELAHGAEEKSLRLQRMFARYGVACLIPGPELAAYIDPALFPSPSRTRPRLLLEDFRPTYPVPDKPRPLVVHAPSNKAKKGTDCVLNVINRLRRTHAFDFRLLHGVLRSEALEIVRSCDVFLDQFNCGDHGLACLEAMAFGKPTVCYIKPSVVSEYPSDCAIVNASQDNLCAVLKALLEERTDSS